MPRKEKELGDMIVNASITLPLRILIKIEELRIKEGVSRSQMFCKVLEKALLELEKE